MFCEDEPGQILPWIVCHVVSVLLQLVNIMRALVPDNGSSTTVIINLFGFFLQAYLFIGITSFWYPKYCRPEILFFTLGGSCGRER